MNSVENTILPYVCLGVVAVSGVCFWWLLSRETARIGARASGGDSKPIPRCRVCGYDLRATPDLCPECGTPPRRGTDGEDDAGPPDIVLDPRLLSTDWPATAMKPSYPTLQPELRLLHASPNHQVVELLADQLRARGVWCHTALRQTYSQSAGMSQRIPVFFVQVPVNEWDRAKAIIERFRYRKPEPAGSPSTDEAA